MSKKLIEIRDFLTNLNFEPPWIYQNPLPESILIPNMPHKIVKKKSILFRQNDICNKAFYIQEGRFRVYYTDGNGNENCIYIAGEGSFLGESSLIDGKPSFYSAIAIVDSKIYEFSKANLLTHCKHSDTFNELFLTNMTQKIRALASEIEFFSKPATVRIAISLLSLANQYGYNHNDNIYIALKFTHEEMSFLTNLNRVTVSNIFSDFIKQGILIKQNGCFEIVNLTSLLNIIRSN